MQNQLDSRMQDVVISVDCETNILKDTFGVKMVSVSSEENKKIAPSCKYCRRHGGLVVSVLVSGFMRSRVP